MQYESTDVSKKTPIMEKPKKGICHLIFFFPSHPFLTVCAGQRGPRRLGAGGSSQLASARTVGKSASSPSTPSSLTGSSSKLLASARWAATEAMPTQRWAYAAAAARRKDTGSPRARAEAARRMKSAASSDHLPPISSAMITRRHRAAVCSSGYT